MNFVEILKANGLTDEVIAKVSADMKANKVYLASEENLDVRYNKLKLESEANAAELQKSQALIKDLQSGTKANEELQSKIKEYESEIKELKANNEKQRLESALDRALIEAKVQDVDYVKFKLKEKGEELKLDENGKLANVKDILDGLKIQLPNQFSSTEKKVDELKLPTPQGEKAVKDYSKMTYAERVKLFQEDRDTFDAITKKNKLKEV